MSERSSIPHSRSGFTLIEFLAVIAVIAALASLSIPAWSAMTRARANSAAMTLTMGALEQARLAATSGKKEVWLLFKNDDSTGKSSLRIICRDNAGYSPLGTWILLPQGIRFQDGENNLMDQPPPKEIIASALGPKSPPSSLPPGVSLGGVQFLRSGRVGIPQQGGPALSLKLRNKNAALPEPITLSRGTGRATCP